MTRRVAIIDYGMCNLFSVDNACRAVGLDPVITSDPARVLAADRVILPGVGAFGQAMRNMREAGLDEAVRDFAATGRPLLGVCLGLQLLFEKSEEFGSCEGLGLIPGRVVRFAFPQGEKRVKVPQVGWNAILPPQGGSFLGTPLARLAPGAYMYFCHSFLAAPDDPAHVAATTSYGGTAYCSAARRGNVFAVQFHPEKSGPPGLSIYEAWADWTP